MNRLRTLLMLGVLGLVASPPATSQTTLAVHGGLNRADLDITGVALEGQASINRTVAGASLTVPVFGDLAVRFGAAYVEKGGLVSIGQSIDFTLDFAYVELSALARGRVLDLGDRASLYLLAGPMIDVELSCEIEGVDRLRGISVVAECGLTGPGGLAGTASHTLDYGFVGGAGTEVHLPGQASLLFEGLYSHGLRSLNKENPDRTLKHRGLIAQFGLGYRFR